MLPKRLQIVLCLSVGDAVGMFLFAARVVSQAIYYLSDTPETCMNCHVMTDAYAGNGMGFHSLQESMRLWGGALNRSQEARFVVARILASMGVTSAPVYPDYGTWERAWEVVQVSTGQIKGGLKLLP